MSRTAVAPKGSQYRWVVCALLFFATTLNYVDRQVFGILGPTLTEEFHWTESDFSFIVSAFTLAYAFGYAAAGRVIDRIGVGRGLAMVVGLWSLAAMMHGLVRPLVDSGLPWLNAVFAGTFLGGLTPAVLSVAGFSVARFTLGLAESGNFPAAIKAVGQWHPKSERALSTGIFNSGSQVGVIVAAYAVPFVVERMGWGWPAAFYLTGALGFVWLVFWWAMYDRPEQHPRVTASELAHIRSDPPDPPEQVPWLSLFAYRQTWAYVTPMFLIGPVWWFYLYWMPKFLKNNYNIDLRDVFWPLLLVYTMSSVGSVAGGWFSSWLIARGTSVPVARKTAFWACSICTVPVAWVSQITNLWAAMLVVGLAAAAHAGYAANLYTIVSDTLPRKVVSSAVGIGGTASCVGMLLFSTTVGYILDRTQTLYGEKSYVIPFLYIGAIYVVATALIHVLLRKPEV